MNSQAPIREGYPVSGNRASTTPSWDNWFQQVFDALKGWTRSLTTLATLDFPSIAAQSQQSLPVVFAGVQPGNMVQVMAASDVSGVIFTGAVVVPDIVTVYAKNFTAGAVNPPASISESSCCKPKGRPMPAVKLSPFGNSQTVNAVGAPASGWKIYTYQAGSSTPLAAYTDSTGNVAQSNPIILNALGFPTNGQIWLQAGIAYKVVLTDASDVVQKTRTISAVSTTPPARFRNGQPVRRRPTSTRRPSRWLAISGRRSRLGGACGCRSRLARCTAPSRHRSITARR